MGDPVTSPDKKPPREGEDERSEGQYGGLKRGLGYGAGRDIKDAERPAKDIDPDEDESHRQKDSNERPREF